jgi:DNA-binding MarR family transcriptional regulator
MKKRSRAGELDLTWGEIGLLCQGMSLASRPMDLAVKQINDEYSLAPRGAWITVLIATGLIHPLELAEQFRVGRSLITAELTRLADAGLIQFEQHARDGRRTELKLTPLGNTVQRRVREELSKLMLRRLAAYTREEILLCSRMLHDFRVPQSDDSESTAPANVKRRLKAKRPAAPAARRQRRSRKSA